MRETFSILFYANRSKERNGLIPILCRITVNGTIAQFSCKFSVPTKEWDPKAQKVDGRSDRSTKTNLMLQGIKSRIFALYQAMVLEGNVQSAAQIRDLYFGRSETQATLLDAMDKQNNNLTSRVGIDRSLSTLQKYRVARKHVSDYIQKYLNKKDIAMSELNEDFIRGFCLYLREEARVSQSSVWVYQMPLRSVVTAAFKNGIIKKNPFVNYHVQPDFKERQFLSEDQLRRLMEYRLPSNSILNHVRDLFVFCCFTGLSFIDLKNLTPDNLIEVNGTRWIISQRHKTKVHFQAKLLPAALRVLKQHGSDEPGKPVFNVGKYCTENLRLKQLGQLSGVSSNLTFHVARHTFATLALSKGMSIESLQSILGHTDLHTTQIYAKITTNKLEKDYTRVYNELMKNGSGVTF